MPSRSPESGWTRSEGWRSSSSSSGVKRSDRCLWALLLRAWPTTDLPRSSRHAAGTKIFLCDLIHPSGLHIGERLSQGGQSLGRVRPAVLLPDHRSVAEVAGFVRHRIHPIGATRLCHVPRCPVKSCLSCGWKGALRPGQRARRRRAEMFRSCLPPRARADPGQAARA